jgi:type VI secretion system protein ImpF
MPLRDGRVPVITSVVDRLTDSPRNSPQSGVIGSVRPGTLGGLRHAVLRDLEHLLNTRREDELIPADYHESAASLLNYGLPDLSVYSLKSAAEQHRLRRSMETALRLFEPRLSNVSVAVEGWDAAKPVLRFRVDAVLVVEPAPEPVVFDTEFSLESRRFTLKGRSR